MELRTVGMRRIGVISDTHRFVRPEALTALRDVEHIIHAGDIGSPLVIDELRRIAAVTAVRGNVDHGDLYPETAVVELGGALIYVIHSIDDLDLDPRAAGFSAVIYGHSHSAAQEARNGVLYFNPGSAGPRRFHLPVSIGYLTVRSRKITGEIVHLDV